MWRNWLCRLQLIDMIRAKQAKAVCSVHRQWPNIGNRSRVIPMIATNPHDRLLYRFSHSLFHFAVSPVWSSCVSYPWFVTAFEGGADLDQLEYRYRRQYFDEDRVWYVKTPSHSLGWTAVHWRRCLSQRNPSQSNVTCYFGFLWEREEHWKVQMCRNLCQHELRVLAFYQQPERGHFCASVR